MGNASHDELGYFGPEPRIVPPTQSAFDGGIELFRFVARPLRGEPAACQSHLEIPGSGVLFEYGPGRAVHRIPGAEGWVVNIFSGDPGEAGSRGIDDLRICPVGNREQKRNQ